MLFIILNSSFLDRSLPSEWLAWLMKKSDAHDFPFLVQCSMEKASDIMEDVRVTFVTIYVIQYFATQNLTCYKQLTCRHLFNFQLKLWYSGSMSKEASAKELTKQQKDLLSPPDIGIETLKNELLVIVNS